LISNARVQWKLNITLTSSGPVSAPGHLNETYSWHLLCTPKLHTKKKEEKKEISQKNKKP